MTNCNYINPAPADHYICEGFFYLSNRFTAILPIVQLFSYGSVFSFYYAVILYTATPVQNKGIFILYKSYSFIDNSRFLRSDLCEDMSIYPERYIYAAVPEIGRKLRRTDTVADLY